MKNVHESPKFSHMDWYKTAFTALHDLSLDIEGAVTPDHIAQWAIATLKAVNPTMETAVWWFADSGVDVIAGNPPKALRHLAGFIPETLCLIHQGSLIEAAFFGIDNECWQFVPISDRSTLYGWIGGI